MDIKLGQIIYIVYGSSIKDKDIRPVKEFTEEKWQGAIKFAFKLIGLGWENVSIKEFTITKNLPLTRIKAK